MLLLLLRLPSSCNSSIDFKKFHNSRREINLLRIEDQDHFTTHTYYVLYKVFDMDGIDFKVLGSTMSSIFESSLFPPRSYCDENTFGIYFVQNLSNPYWTLCTRMQPSLMRKTYISSFQNFYCLTPGFYFNTSTFLMKTNSTNWIPYI